MKLKIFYSLLALSLTISCATQEEISSTTTSHDTDTGPTLPLSTPVTKAKTLVENNTYIDVDMGALNKVLVDYIRANGIPKYNITADLYPEEYEMSRAAMYRFYSKIVIEDGLPVCTAKNAKELNMSERTFKYMDDNIKQIHQQCLQAKAEGIEVDAQPISADYLNFFIK